MGEIESTEGVEQLTWYRDGRESPARIKVTYPNRRIELSAEQAEIMGEEEGALSPGTVEMSGGRNDSYGIMGIRSPEELFEIAESLALAANFWRHEIMECECFEPSPDDAESSFAVDGEMPEGMKVQELPGGGVMISMSAPLSEIFGASDPEPSSVPDQD